MLKKFNVLFYFIFWFGLISINADENKIETDELIKVFGKNFDIDLSEEWLTFTSKKKVRTFVNINSPEGMTTEEMIKQSDEKNYIIRFYFNPIKVSEEHYLMLRKFEKEINDEARKSNKGKAFSEKAGFASFLKPTYFSSDYSIYMFKSSGNWEKIIGDDDNKLINSVLEYFDKKYKKYQTKEDIERDKIMENRKKKKEEREKEENKEEKK